MTTSPPRRPRLAVRLLGLGLASAFLIGQAALSFHYHAARAQTRGDACVSPADDCALCAFQIAPSASSTVVAVVAPPVEIVAFDRRVAALPRDARPARISDRSPPALRA